MGFWSVLPLIGSILGALVFIIGSIGAEGAPQEAVAAAAGAALAIIPYVFARAVSEINASVQGKMRRTELAKLIVAEMQAHEGSVRTLHSNRTESNKPIHVSATIRNPADESKSWEGTFLVDTNVKETMVPGYILESIGIITAGKREYTLADGSRNNFDFAPIKLEVMDNFAGTTALFVSVDSEPTIGTIALTSAGLEIDPISVTLKKSDPRHI